MRAPGGAENAVSSTCHTGARHWNRLAVLASLQPARVVADLRARRAQQLEQTYINELATKLSISINEIELAKLQPGLR